jgi:hypothetical protein
LDWYYMPTPTINAGEPHDYGLLHLLTDAQSDGRAVQYFVCYDCLKLVESKAGSIHVHDCPAMTQQARRMQ